MYDTKYILQFQNLEWLATSVLRSFPPFTIENKNVEPDLESIALKLKIFAIWNSRGEIFYLKKCSKIV